MSSSDMLNAFKKCKLNNKKCLKESIEDGISKLANGLPDIELPPLDPFFFGTSGMEFHDFSERYTNLTFFGYSQIKICDIEFDLDSCRIKLDFLLPKTRYHANVHWEGTVDGRKINITNLMRMECGIRFNANINSIKLNDWFLENSTAISALNCKKLKRNDVEYLEIVDGKSDFDFGNVVFKFEDSTASNPADPEKEVDLIKPLADQCFEWLLQFVCNKIFSNIPVSELFLKFDLESCHLHLEYEIPKSEYDALFHWKGVLDGNEINITSTIKLQCANSKSINAFKCRKVKKYDKEYLEIIDGESDLVFGNVTFNVESFSKDNPELNINFNDYVDVFKKCKINDKVCLKESIENGLPKLVNGLQEIDFPPLDPYFFGNASVEVGGFLQEYSNIMFYGYENIDVLDIDFDLESCRIKFDFVLPKTGYEGGSHWKGVLNGEEINVTSYIKLQCENSTSINIFNCKKFKKDVVEYLEIVDGESDFSFGNITSQNFNADNSDTNEYVGRNAQSEMSLLRRMANVNEEWIIQFLSNKIFSKIPLSELFLN
ncbi:hypothetical protein FQR65_LT03642 [Abscondita terminalis]|nr:hypothetical protein FQR65_LT03642 [Abscondita terminalis]